MFDETRGNGKNIRIKDNVRWVEVGLIHKKIVGTLADGDLCLFVGRLAVFVKGHDHNRGTLRKKERKT